VLATNLLAKAFHVMDPSNTGKVSRESIFAVFYILNEDFPEIRHLTRDEANLLFGFLDKDGTSTITMDEFLEFGNVLLLEFTKESDYATVVEIHFPKIYESAWYQTFSDFVRSTTFEYIIDFILILNAVVVAIQSYPELSGADVAMDPHYSDGYVLIVFGPVSCSWGSFLLTETILPFRSRIPQLQDILILNGNSLKRFSRRCMFLK
jgi:two pore calcium channel protein